MASHVIGPFATFAHPLSARQVLLLYVAVLWQMSMLEDETMTSDDGWYLTGHAQYGVR